MDLDSLSNEELRAKLVEYGVADMPVISTTRKILTKKLRLLMDGKKKANAEERRSLTRFSSEEESDTDSKITKKRSATSMQPPKLPVRKSKKEEPPKPVVKKGTVQDDFDTGSDTEPEIIDDSHLDLNRASSTRYSSPRVETSFNSRYSSFTRGSMNRSSPSGDQALDKLNQIRSRLSLGNTSYDKASLDSGDAVETPFLSNFTRRLSQMSNSNRPDYDSKNDIIKEHDTNGANLYTRNFRSPRFHDINRDFQTRQESNIFKNNLVSFAVIGVALLFFVVIGVMYLGIRSDTAVDTTGYVLPYCLQTDPNAKKGINCILPEDSAGAVNVLTAIRPELHRRAMTFKCSDGNVMPYMTHKEIGHYLSGRVHSQNIFDDLTNFEVLTFKNPDWGISIVQVESKYVSEDNIVGDMEQVAKLRDSATLALIILNPGIPWKCVVYNKLSTIINMFAILLVGFTILYASNATYKYHIKNKQRRQDEIFRMVEQIGHILQTHAAKGGDNFLVINHVRDMLLPANNRKRLEPIWTDAVKFINENESRIRTEVQVVVGEPFEVWRWLGNTTFNSSPRAKVWQGQAFETQDGSVNSLACSPTPCLKIRGMIDENDRSFQTIPEAVLSKCAHQCRILHCAVDSTSRCVYLKCADQNDAAVAYRNLHGWWYAGHLVTVKYLRLERYMQRFPESPVGGPPFLKAVNPATDWSS